MKDIFVTSHILLGAQAFVLGAPSNTLNCRMNHYFIKPASEISANPSTNPTFEMIKKNRYEEIKPTLKIRLGLWCMVDLKSKLRVKINEYVNLHDPLIVCGLNALHGLGLAGEVKVVVPHDDTGGHDKLAMEAKGANIVEEKEREKPMEGKEAGG